MIDPAGRYILRTPINVLSVFDVPLPRALEPTLFSRWGTSTPFVFPLLIILWAAYTKKRRRNSLSYDL